MEVLTFAILLIRLLIEPEPVEIMFIRSPLNVPALYFEDPGLVVDQR